MTTRLEDPDDERDDELAFLLGPSRPLAPPPGAFDRAHRRATRRRTLRVASFVGGIGVAAAAVLGPLYLTGTPARPAPVTPLAPPATHSAVTPSPSLPPTPKPTVTAHPTRPRSPSGGGRTPGASTNPEAVPGTGGYGGGTGGTGVSPVSSANTPERATGGATPAASGAGPSAGIGGGVSGGG